MVMGFGEITEVKTEECWRLLASTELGRIATSAGASIDIFPVNYAVDGESIVFRTAPGTKLLEAGDQ